MGGRPTPLGAHPATSSSINGLPRFTSMHHKHSVFIASIRALISKQSRESLGEKDRVERIEKRVGSKESEQELKS